MLQITAVQSVTRHQVEAAIKPTGHNL